MNKLTTMLWAGVIAVAISFGAGCQDDRKAPPPAADTKAAPATPPEDQAPVSTGLPDCDAYIAAVETYVKCDKVEPQDRDSVTTGLDAMKQTWGNLAGVPDDIKKQTNDACRQAVESLRHGATSHGCAI